MSSQNEDPQREEAAPAQSEGDAPVSSETAAEQSVTAQGETEPERPAFDIEAARLRYRQQMKSRPVRLIFGLSFLILLCTWGIGGLAAFSPDVERLPNHDVSVGRPLCIDCHTRRVQGAPAFSHSSAPTCGFCHRQSLPTPTPLPAAPQP